MKSLGYILLLLTTFILASCTSKKTLRKLETLTIADVAVSPDLLKQEGNHVPLQMQIKIQPDFHKTWELTLTPHVETAAGIQDLVPMTFVGKSNKLDHGIVVPRKEGYTGMQPYSFVYNPIMDKAIIVVTGILTHKGREVARYVWNPYNSRIVAQPPITPQDSAKKLMPGEMKAVIIFKVATANIIAGKEYIKNVQINLQKIFSCKSAYLTKVIYSASCSPEGSLAFNQQLAKKRLVVGQKFFNNKLNLPKLRGYNNPGVVQTEMIAESWQALYNLIEDSSLENKYQMINALKKTPNLQAREKLLQSYIAKYPVFQAQYLVMLRNVWLTIEYMAPYHKVETTKYPPIGPFTE